MKIDNSGAEIWSFCPRKYQEVYVNGWTRQDNSDARGFGGRVHELLASHFLKQDRPTEFSEEVPDFVADEAEELFAAYVAHYPVEDFDVLDVERYFEVPIPESDHVYIGKLDGVVRDQGSGRLRVFEHKTEARGAKSNLPEVWAARSQVSLYMWATEKLYGEAPESIILDVLTRRSPAGRIPPTFRRDSLQRSSAQQAEAVRNIKWIADEIVKCSSEFGEDNWPAFMGNCNRGGFKCDFYLAHVVAESQVIELDELTRNRYYALAEDYLHT